MMEIEQTEYMIERSPKNGEYTLILNNDKSKQYVLSKYEPRQKANSLLGEDWGNKSTNWIIFGFNFGYTIDKLTETVSDKVNILIIEPNELLLKEEMQLVEKNNRYTAKNIRFFTGTEFSKLKQTVDEMFGTYEFNNFRIISNEVYLLYYGEYCKKALSVIDQCIDDKIINFNTIVLGNVQYIINTVRNRLDIAETCDMGYLRDKYKGIPAVVVSAGPSLDKNIKYLREFNGLIFVMGRTLTPVLKLGVRPDFVVSLDPYDLVYETFGENKEYDIPLITLCQSNPKVVRGCKSYKYFLHNSSELEGLLGMRVNPVLDLSGSVATLCLSSAVFLGCSPVMFIGQDLAFEGERMYATDSNAINSRTTFENNPDLKWIKSFYGKQICSNVNMISFLRWIEKFISEHPQSEYINCTEGGAYIEGASHMSFMEAIKQYNPDKKVTVTHKKLSDREGIDIENNFKNALIKLDKMKGLLEEGATKYGELVNMYESNKLVPSILTKNIKRIQKIDKKIEEIPGSEMLMKMLMERVQYAVAADNENKESIGETQEELRDRKLKLNYQTYTYLMKECNYILTLLRNEVSNE